MKKVIVLGASPKEDRYSNKAVKMLSEFGYEVIPVSPSGAIIHNIQSIKKLNECPINADTITVYVNPEISKNMVADFISLKPRRIILNPGTESATLETACAAAGIKVIRACTLVLLQTAQF